MAGESFRPLRWPQGRCGPHHQGRLIGSFALTFTSMVSAGLAFSGCVSAA